MAIYFSDIRKTCEEYLSNNWTLTPIAWDNSEFDVPTTSWIRATLNPILTENAAIGISKRDYASLTIQIFTPLNEGAGNAYGLAAEIEKLFGNVEVDDLTFYTTETTRIGDEGNGWYQINVRAVCYATSNC